MASVKAYIEETVDELMNKVSWPTWDELQSSSIIVLVATTIIALIIYVMDVSSSSLLKLIYETLS